MTPRQLVFRRIALLVAAVCAVLSSRPAAAEALLVVELDSGKVLHADQATTPWYPASITKILTVYVALRAVKEGRMKLDSLLRVSVNAAAAAPTKMGFPPGTTVTARCERWRCATQKYRYTPLSMKKVTASCCHSKERPMT
jgi:D-alanyl-D-alanine carboxypeptidase